MAERRKYRRKGILWHAQLQTLAGHFDCRVVNLSPRGASIEVDHPVEQCGRVPSARRTRSKPIRQNAEGGSTRKPESGVPNRCAIRALRSCVPPTRYCAVEK